MENFFDFAVILLGVSLLLGGWLNDRGSRRITTPLAGAYVSTAASRQAARSASRSIATANIDDLEDLQRRFERARQRADALLQWHRRLHNREAA